MDSLVVGVVVLLDVELVLGELSLVGNVDEGADEAGDFDHVGVDELNADEGLGVLGEDFDVFELESELDTEKDEDGEHQDPDKFV